MIRKINSKTNSIVSGKINRILRKFTCVGLATLLAFSSIQQPVMADNIANDSISLSSDEGSSYGEYKSKLTDNCENESINANSEVGESKEAVEAQVGESKEAGKTEGIGEPGEADRTEGIGEPGQNGISAGTVKEEPDESGEVGESAEAAELEEGKSEEASEAKEDKPEGIIDAEDSEADTIVSDTDETQAAGEEDSIEDMFVYEEGILGDAVYIDETGALVINTEGTSLENLSDDEIIEIVSEEMMNASTGNLTISMNFQFGQSEARSILSMVNKFRKNKDTAWYWNASNTKKEYFSNLQNLTYDYDLEQVAMLRAAEIALSWGHTRPNDERCLTAYEDMGYSYYTAGENIAAGYMSAAAAFTGWCETNEKYAGQGHRRAMLSSNYTCIGIGHVIFNGTNYWTQEFSGSNQNTVATTAINGSAKVTTEIARSQIKDLSFSLNKTSATVNEDETYKLPGGKYSFVTRYSWPYEVKISSKCPILEWEVPEQYEEYVYLYAEEDAVYAHATKEGAAGKETNSLKLTAKDGSLSKSFTLNIKCVHDETLAVVPATLYSDGTVGTKCVKCGYTSAKTTKHIDSVTLSQSSALWNGSDVRPTITVKDTSGKKVPKEYYSVSVKTAGGKDVDDDSEGDAQGCINPGIYKITVSSVEDSDGNKKYDFEKTLTFTINPKSIAAKDVSAKVNSEGVNYIYVGARICPDIILLDKGYVTGNDAETGAVQYYRLVEGQDYNVEYSANKSVGTATATIIGTGNYSGIRAIKYAIKAASFSAENIVITGSGDMSFSGEDVKSTKGACLGYTYTGAALKPTVSISVLLPAVDGGTQEYTLIEGTDYTVTYKNNVSCYKYIEGDASYSSKKTPIVVVTGKGNFSTAGTFKYTFPIGLANLNACNAAEVYLDYSGSNQKPAPVIYGLNGKALKNKNDYSIAGYCRIHSDDENKKTGEIDAFSYDLETESVTPSESGKYVIVCKGKGSYAESAIAIPLTIANESEKLISKVKITVPSVSFPESMPAQEKVLVQDGKKKLRGFCYEQNTDGKSDDEIYAEAMAAYNTALNNAATAAEYGEQEDQNKLEELKAVSFIYYAKNNYKVGTATMYFVAIGGKGYIGNTKKTYKINGVAMSKVKINNFKASKVYDGTRKTQNFGNTTENSIVFLKYSEKGKEPVILNYDVEDPENSDYTVTYSYPKGTNVGTVNVVIKGNPLKGYTGTIKKTFKVTAKKLDSKEIKKAETEIIIDGQAPFGSLKTMNYTGVVTSPRPVIYYVPGGIADLYVESDISLLDGAMSLVAQEDYTISYENNLKRAASSDKKCPTVTIKGKGNYAGTLKLTYNISSEDVEGSIFVASNGHDPESINPGNGSLAKPYATLQAALNVAAPGNVIYMRGGTYKGSTVISSACSGNDENGNITITNFPGEKVYLTGVSKSDEAVLTFNNNAHNVTISGLNIGNYSSKWACGILIDCDDNSEQGIHDIILENNTISKVKTSDIKNCGANAILLSGRGSLAGGANSIRNIVIRNNSVHDNVNGLNENISVTGNCENITITGNKVYKNTNIGIDLYGNNDGEAYCQNSVLNHPRNCIISNNVVYNCKCKYAQCAGIYVDGAYGDSYENGILITGNEVYANQYGIEIGSEEWRGYYGNGVNGKDSNGYDHHVRYVSVINNNIHDNPYGGIRIGGYTNSPEVVSEDNPQPYTGWVVNCRISGNYLTNNGTGSGGYNGEIHFSKCDNITVSNNMITQGKNNKKYPVYGYDWGDDSRPLNEKIWATNLTIE